MNAPQAFDVLAPGYDLDFTRTAIAHYLRRRVHACLDCHFQPGDQVLELGCGTGEDALYLAGRGVRVLATDVSDGMLGAARQKTAGNPLVRVEQLDLQNLPVGATWQVAPTTTTFDGVFSNFGPLNCVDNLKSLADWLAQRIKSGGIAAFGVMSPLCLWEIGWHGLHGNFGKAFRRMRKNTTFRPEGSSEAITIHYPTIHRLTRDFTPWFRRIHIQPLGLFLPPSDVYGAIEKHPRLLKALMSLERHFGEQRHLALLADHYWIEFERTASSPDANH